MDKESHFWVAWRKDTPQLSGVSLQKVGGTDWKGGWHRLKRWVAPIGKVGGTD